MTYSVWDPVAKIYEYYAAPPRPSDIQTPTPMHLKETHGIGVPTESAAWPLPMGAKRIGRGAVAKGMVAKRPGNPAMGDVADTAAGVSVGTLLAAGVLIYLALRK